MDGTKPGGAPDVHALRVPLLHARRDLKMARDPHAFVRGSTKSFYECLANVTTVAIPQGPTVWICGDAHVGNLGPIARCDERVVVELRDLDQSVPGNPAHDLVRLGLSLAMAARSSTLPGVVTAQLMEELTSGYLAALDEPEHTEPSHDSAAVRFVLREALKRKWQHLRRESFRKRPKLPFGRRFMKLGDDERQAVEAFLDRERVRQLVTLIECRDDEAQTRVLDAAFWVKGCSSLGLWRCAALIEVAGHGASRGRYSLLDLKEAVAPIAPITAAERLPTSNAERVVRGAQALSPALGKRMLFGELLGRSVFVRELMPQDLKIELEMMDANEARATARALAHVVGIAHGRQMDLATRTEWRNTLENATTRWLDAPSWLWSSVTELIGIHERAYLEHCRRYALRLEKAGQGAAA